MSNLHRLRVSFASASDLEAGIRPGLSRTHIFAATDEQIAAGTRVRLEMGLAGNPPAIRGIAKVSEADSEEWEATPVPGLHLDVVHLDPPSTRFVDSLLRGEAVEESIGQNRQQGPFESKAEREALPGPGLVMPRPPAPRRSLGWAAALVALLGVLLLGFFVYPRGGDAAAPELTDDSSAVGETPEPAADPVEEPATAPPEEPAAEPEPPPDLDALAADAERVALAWATAWSEQNADDYLALYAPDYSPPDVSREVWESQRRVRIAAPDSITVTLSEIEVEMIDDTHAVARFHQHYLAGDKNLAARKALEMERLDGAWRIVGERVEPAR